MYESLLNKMQGNLNLLLNNERKHSLQYVQSAKHPREQLKQEASLKKATERQMDILTGLRLSGACVRPDKK